MTDGSLTTLPDLLLMNWRQRFLTLYSTIHDFGISFSAPLASYLPQLRLLRKFACAGQQSAVHRQRKLLIHTVLSKQNAQGRGKFSGRSVCLSSKTVHTGGEIVSKNIQTD